MSDEWSTEALALRVVKLLANWEERAADHRLEGAPIALHAEHFWDAFGERAGEAIDHARIKGWVTDLGPTSSRHYRLTDKGRELAADVTAIGPQGGTP
jgi:hypothetical protein